MSCPSVQGPWGGGLGIGGLYSCHILVVASINGVGSSPPCSPPQVAQSSVKQGPSCVFFWCSWQGEIPVSVSPGVVPLQGATGVVAVPGLAPPTRSKASKVPARRQAPANPTQRPAHKIPGLSGVPVPSRGDRGSVPPSQAASSAGASASRVHKQSTLPRGGGRPVSTRGGEGGTGQAATGGPRPSQTAREREGAHGRGDGEALEGRQEGPGPAVRQGHPRARTARADRGAETATREEQTALAQVSKESVRRKQDNRIKHSKPGTVKTKAERDKAVVKQVD